MDVHYLMDVLEKGFKKDHDGFVNRLEEFVIPSFKLNQDKVDEIPTVGDATFGRH